MQAVPQVRGAPFRAAASIGMARAGESAASSYLPRGRSDTSGPHRDDCAGDRTRSAFGSGPPAPPGGPRAARQSAARRGSRCVPRAGRHGIPDAQGRLRPRLRPVVRDRRPERTSVDPPESPSIFPAPADLPEPLSISSNPRRSAPTPADLLEFRPSCPNPLHDSLTTARQNPGMVEKAPRPPPAGAPFPPSRRYREDVNGS